jgi:hypothetical protein
MFFIVFLYPMNILVKLWLFNFALRFPLRFTQTLDPNTFNLVKSSLASYHTSCGVMPVRECTRMLGMNTVCSRAADQYTAESEAP